MPVGHTISYLRALYRLDPAGAARRWSVALVLGFGLPSSAWAQSPGGSTSASPTSDTAAGATGDADFDQLVTRLPDYVVQGRQDDLTGAADSATQGTVGYSELADRPLLRTGEILETIPGVIITQHAGGGKANQYFTRGFNLDHGTDFSTDIDGMPVNLASHAHGQGYADLNILIPELIEQLDFEKGPYYAANGDFSTVGAAHIDYADTLPGDTLKLEGGSDGYARALAVGSLSAASGHLLYGFEAYHENGPWVVPDDYSRYNGVLRYSQGNAALGFSVMAMAYHGSWKSTDQVAESAVDSGLIPFYGSQNPTDGGYSQRYSVIAEWHEQDGGTSTQVVGYAFHYDLNLFSDFTYYLESPDGDQFEQQDNRNVLGVKAVRSLEGRWFGRRVVNTFGLQAQESLIDLGLFQTVGRVRTDKVAYDGSVIPATTKVDTVSEGTAGVYIDNRIWWTGWFRTDFGLREDVTAVDVSDLDPANSGRRAAALPSPKLNLVFGPWDQTEVYAEAGYGFHSNDARAVTATVNPDDSIVGTRLPLLVAARGAEIGIRSTAVPKLQSTLSLWWLRSDSELYFNGIDADSGETTASQQATHRYGIELSNYYTPLEWLTFDLDYADSWAYFDSPTTAAQDLTPGGTLVDEAVHQTLSTGVTARGKAGWEATVRLRYFGPRPLTSDGSVRSRSTLVANLGLGYRIDPRWRLTAEVLNFLNRHDHDIDYYYQSRNSPAPSSPALNEDHFHPEEPIELRLGVEATF
jgi:hypothetical protein